MRFLLLGLCFSIRYGCFCLELQLQRKFRKFNSHTGMTPLQYLLEIRLSYASKLLESANLQISEISELVGYDNALYFSRLFHRHIGERPREYRDRFQKERGYLHAAAISLILFRTISISSFVPMVIRI